MKEERKIRSRGQNQSGPKELVEGGYTEPSWRGVAINTKESIGVLKKEDCSDNRGGFWERRKVYYKRKQKIIIKNRLAYKKKVKSC